MRAMVLLSDAFGGRGGIAKFNRDFLGALSLYPGVEEIVVLPRVVVGLASDLPPRIQWRDEAAGGWLRYISCALRVVLGPDRRPATPGCGPGFDWIVCAHLNLLPLACLVRAVSDRKTGAARTPMALVIHGKEAWEPSRRILVRRLIRQVELVVAVSEFTSRRFGEWAGLQGVPVLIVPNCVDSAVFQPGPKNERLALGYGLRGRPVLMTLARLDARERYKGIDEVLELMPRLLKELPGACYVIAGEGDDRARLVSKACSLGLRVGEGAGARGTADVLFTGYVAEDAKVEHYRLADVFVMPGRGEGFGIVYLEALACGVPVVGSKLDASGELLTECDMGFVVDPRDPEDLLMGIWGAFGCSRGRVPGMVQSFSRDCFNSRVRELMGGLDGNRKRGEVGLTVTA